MIPARISDCVCPGSPHADGDEVYLLPKLTFDGGVAATAALRSSLGEADGTLDRKLGRSYLEWQVSGWNRVDENGDVPFDLDVILSDWSIAAPIAEKADELYSEALLAPLVRAAEKSSRAGQTAPSTSRKTASSSTNRKR